MKFYSILINVFIQRSTEFRENLRKMHEDKGRGSWRGEWSREGKAYRERPCDRLLSGTEAGAEVKCNTNLYLAVGRCLACVMFLRSLNVSDT